MFDDAPAFNAHITVASGIDIDPESLEQIRAVLNAAKVAASSVDRIDIVCSQLTYGSKYFKKVYLKADRSLELVSLALICHEEFVALPRILREKSRNPPEGSNNSLNVPSNTTSDRKSTSSVASGQFANPSSDSNIITVSRASPEYKAAAAEAALEAAQWAEEEFDPHLSLVYSSTYPIEEATKTTIDSRLRDVFGEDFMKKRFGFRGARLSLVNCEGPVEDWKILGYRDF